mmetsp:Transcript_19979/g.60683  ORF Transcript_19979/g.60683 Transcript_19979/m.60683 type:complete len:93 (+) Transcript_19979:1563-1841(+)|eukprot:scaffold141856_cov32-Tisochrysis_lutea.AAC.4
MHVENARKQTQYAGAAIADPSVVFPPSASADGADIMPSPRWLTHAPQPQLPTLVAASAAPHPPHFPRRLRVTSPSANQHPPTPQNALVVLVL